MLPCWFILHYAVATLMSGTTMLHMVITEEPCYLSKVQIEGKVHLQCTQAQMHLLQETNHSSFPPLALRV